MRLSQAITCSIFLDHEGILIGTAEQICLPSGSILSFFLFLRGIGDLRITGKRPPSRSCGVGLEGVLFIPVLVCGRDMSGFGRC
jgi:hypothetical protein